MYLIVGATGSLGGGVATRLLVRGDPVRVIVRSSSPSRSSARHTTPQALAELGAEMVEADLTHPETLKGICQGVRAVVFTASGTKRTPPDTVGMVDITGSGILAREAVAAGVDQFVYISTLGASPDHQVGIFKAKGLAEEQIRESGVGHTILHPVKFMQDWIGFLLGSQIKQSGRVQLVGPGDVITNFVDESDVAETAVAVLGREDTLGETIPLASEAATYADLLGRISKVTGKPIEWSSIKAGETVDTVDPTTSDTVSALLGVAAMAPPDGRVFPETADRFGIQPTSIDDYLRATFA